MKNTIKEFCGGNCRCDGLPDFPESEVYPGNVVENGIAAKFLQS